MVVVLWVSTRLRSVYIFLRPRQLTLTFGGWGRRKSRKEEEEEEEEEEEKYVVKVLHEDQKTRERRDERRRRLRMPGVDTT